MGAAGWTGSAELDPPPAPVQSRLQAPRPGDPPAGAMGDGRGGRSGGSTERGGQGSARGGSGEGGHTTPHHTATGRRTARALGGRHTHTHTTYCPGNATHSTGSGQDKAAHTLYVS